MANSRRQRKPKAARMDLSVPAVASPPGWPDAVEIRAGIDCEAFARRELELVDEGQVLRLLEAIPVNFRKHMLGYIGLRGAASVNRPMAARVLTRMRQDPSPAECPLLMRLTTPISGVFDEADALAAVWPGLCADAATAAEATAGHPRVEMAMAAIDIALPRAMHRLGLLAAITSHTSGAAAALAFLAREDQDVREAHEKLAADYPSLPAPPSLDFSEVAAAAGRRAARRARGVPADQPGPGADEQAQADDAPARDPDPEDCPDADDPRTRLLAEIDALRPAWSRCERATRRVLAALTEDTPVVTEDLAELTRSQAWAGNVAARAARLLAAECVPSRGGLDAAARALREQAAADERDLLRELCAATGPQPLEGALSTVRTLARQALDQPDQVGAASRAGLIALCRLATLGADRRDGRPLDYQALTAAERLASQRLPTAARGVVLAAVLGDLRLSPQAGQPAPDAVSAAEPPAEEAGVEPVAAEFGDERSDEPLDMSDLDRMLAAGAAAKLAALGVPRQRPAGDGPGNGQSAAPSRRARRRDDAGPAPEQVGPPAEAKPTGPPQAADRDQPTPASVAAAEARLLAESAYGAAAWSRAAHGGPAASVAARKLAGYATALRHPDGAIAAAFSQQAQAVSRAQLAADRAGQLLAWAAAVRVAAFAPAAGADGVLAELAPCVAEHTGLRELGQAAADAARAGLVLPAVADAASNLAAAERAAAEQADAAAKLLAKGEHGTIKYAPATPVYRAWMAPAGVLGSLLRTVAAGDVSTAARVRARAEALRPDADRAIDETFASQRDRRNAGDRIVAGARSTLRKRYLEAVETAVAWAEAAGRLAGDGESGGPLSSLAVLRSRLARVRPRIGGELDAIGAEAPDATVAAAAAAAGRLLASALDDCDGRTPLGPEVSPRTALDPGVGGRLDGLDDAAPPLDLPASATSLTAGQIDGALNHPATALVIGGSPALGLAQVRAVLSRAASARPGLIRWLDDTSSGGLRFAARANPAPATLLADLTAAPTAQVRALLAVADQLDAGPERPRLVLIVAPAASPGWIGWPRRIDLARLDRCQLRAACEHDRLPFAGDAALDALLDVTGGWPTLLDAVAAELTGAGPDADPAAALVEVAARLGSPAGAARLLAQVGLDETTPVGLALAGAFRAVADLTDAAADPPDALIEVLRCDDRLARTAAAAGFASLAAVLETLRALGCVRVDDAGALRAETMLTRALRAVSGAAR